MLLTVAMARLFRICQRGRSYYEGRHEMNAAGQNVGSNPHTHIVTTQPRMLQVANLQSSSNGPQNSAARVNGSLPNSMNVTQPFHNLPHARQNTTLESAGWHHVLEALKRIFEGPPRLPGAGALDPSSRSSKGPFSRAYWVDLWQRMEVTSNLPQLMSGLLYMGGYLGLFACSVFTARLATDNTAVSASPDCGVYLLDPALDQETFFRSSGPYNFDVQVDSAALAQDCYGDLAKADACKFFTHRSISYSVTRNAECAFQEDMCNSPNSSILFSTGAVDARVIGINAPKTYQFRRTTTCSPLKMNDTYVKYHRDGGENVYQYYYGDSKALVDGKENWSYQTRDTGYMPNAPGYLLG